MTIISATTFETLEPVRVWSPVGPCLTGRRRLRKNRSTDTLVFRNGTGYSTERVYKHAIHAEPCRRCEDHPRTVYPNGHMD